MVKETLLHAISEYQTAAEILNTNETIRFLEDLSYLLAKTFRSGNKILIAGNGGSLCDANHFAEELTGFFREKRVALPAIALSEPGHMSCVGNDLGFEYIFSRAIEALGRPGDLFVGLTTSGNSPNLVHAFNAAKSQGMVTVAFLGKGGGKLLGVADHEWIVNGFKYSDRIQELHMAGIHMVIEAMENLLFPSHEAVEAIKHT